MDNKKEQHACQEMMDGYRSITFVFHGFRRVYVKPVQIVRYIGNKSSNMVATFLDQQFEQ